jgi:hypothetical protein
VALPRPAIEKQRDIDQTIEQPTEQAENLYVRYVYYFMFVDTFARANATANSKCLPPVASSTRSNVKQSIQFN